MKLTKMTVAELKALVWYHSNKDWGVDASTKCVDPGRLKKAALLYHLLTTLRVGATIDDDALRLAAGVWDSTSQADIDHFVSTRTAHQRQSPDDEPDEMKYEEEEEKEEEEKTPFKRQRVNSPSLSLSAHLPSMVTYVRCRVCRQSLPEQDAGKFCNVCATPWYEADRPAPPPSAAVSAGSTAPVVINNSNVINQAAAQANPHSQVVSRLPDRHDIAPLSRAIIKQARDGTRLYTLHELLPLYTRDPHATSFDGDSVYLKFTDGKLGAVTEIDGVPTTASKRTVEDMTQLNEVILHQLVGTIYPDNTDPCKQYMALLSFATDIARQNGFAAAFHYVTAVRDRQWRSIHDLSSAPNLRADPLSPFSMADFHPEYHLAAIQPTPGRPTAPTTPSSRPTSTPKTTDEVCFNWNSGRCKGECHRLHVCRGCRGQHTLAACPSSDKTKQSSPSSGQPRTSKPAGPSVKLEKTG
jgi:hypothetical protein